MLISQNKWNRQFVTYNTNIQYHVFQCKMIKISTKIRKKKSHLLYTVYIFQNLTLLLITRAPEPLKITNAICTIDLFPEIFITFASIFRALYYFLPLHHTQTLNT